MNFFNLIFVNEDNLIIIEEIEKMFFLMMNIFYCLYVIIFILVFVGNIFVFIICYKIYKVMIFVLLCFIVSLVLVDLMFMLLFIFDLIVFIGYGDWFGGDFVCKI